MSASLAAAAGLLDADPDNDDQDPSAGTAPDTGDDGGPAPVHPRNMLPIRPRHRGRDSAGEPKRITPETPHEKPLLKREIVHRLARWLAMKNLAVEMADDDISSLAQECKREYELDDETRSDWKTRYKNWLDMALQVSAPKTYPWPNASNVIFPLITVAALQFNARAYPAIVQGRNVVKGTVIGADDGVQATSAVVPPQPGQDGVGASGPAPVPGPGAPAPGNAMPGMGPQQPNALAQAAGPPAPEPQPGQPVTDAQGNPVWLIKPGAKQKRADNIGRHMSWQLLNEQAEWEEQTDRLLIVTAIAGTMFRKSYFDPSKRRNVAETVDALRVVVNYKAKSFDDAPRVTELIDMYPWEIETMKRSGLWRDVEYGHNVDTSDDPQAPVTFCEQQCRWDLDGDGYDEPLIVTFARDSGELARVVPGFDEEGVEATEDGDILRIEPIRLMTKYGFIPNPDGGVYDVGFGHLLYPINEAINSTINQMFDAGHLANAGGGFIGGGMSLNAGSVRFMVGEYKVINTPGRVAKDNIIPLQFRGPNATLLQLMMFLVDAAKEIASIKDVLSGEIPGANVPGILGLAVIQQGLKVFNAIFKRIHRSLGKDYEKLFRLNRLYLPDTAGYQIGSEYFQIKRSDYEEGAGVEPVSDPDMVTDAQQMAQANFLAQFLEDPHFDGREIRLRMLNAAATAQIDKLLKSQAPPNAAIATQLATLNLQKQQVDLQGRGLDLREQELNIRGAREEAELAIRRGKDKAYEIEMLSRAILNLANARKADNEVDQGWYAQQLAALRHQIDLLNITSEMGGPGQNPAAAAGLAGGAPGDAPGNQAPGSGLLAPPSGVAPAAPVPG
jgi:chaperonin GroES